MNQSWRSDLSSLGVAGAYSLASVFLGTFQVFAATGSGSKLFEVSQKLMYAYNSDDVVGIRSMMNRKMKEKYSYDRIVDIIHTCKSTKINNILRTSFPVSGGKYYGFFAVYGVEGMSSMILEVDPRGHILFWLMGDDLDGKDFNCSLNTF